MEGIDSILVFVRIRLGMRVLWTEEGKGRSGGGWGVW